MNWQRCRKSETTTATFKRWPARDHPYAVVEIVSKFDLPTRYLALYTGDWPAGIVISRHRSRSKAEQACDQHARRKK